MADSEGELGAFAEGTVVYVADRLAVWHPDVFTGLRRHLRRADIRLRQIYHTRDIWCRDYMPIQVGWNRFVQFRYAPDYLNGKERWITPPEICRAVIPEAEVIESAIVLDGGNLVRHGPTAIVTDKVVIENPAISRRQLRRTLIKLLAVERLVIIPQEPGDPLGHADGMVRFIDDRSVLINSYDSEDRQFARRLVRVLDTAGLTPLEVPYSPAPIKHRGIPSARGCYLNFLRTARLIVVPLFDLDEDSLAIEILTKAFPHVQVTGMLVGRLADAGGVLNCVTWSIAV